MDYYDLLLAELEHYIKKTARGHDPVSQALLRTIPGVGNICALVKPYEIEDITRFPQVRSLSLTAAWSRVPGSPTANGTALAARRSTTPISERLYDMCRQRGFTRLLADCWHGMQAHGP